MNVKKRCKSVLKVPIPFKVIPYESTMARQEIRAMSTRQGDEVTLLPSSVGENRAPSIRVFIKEK